MKRFFLKATSLIAKALTIAAFHNMNMQRKMCTLNYTNTDRRV